ncbi:MAG: VCBS repeat-containing protein, partial [Pirellulaceae bacterium]
GPNGSIQGPAEAKWGYSTLSIADWDGDQLPDILVNGIWGRVILLRNVGTRRIPRLDAPRVLQVAWKGKSPKPAWTWWKPGPNELVTQWRTTPIATDWTGDGLVDLLSLDHEGYLSLYERSRQAGKLVLLPPQRVFYAENNSVTDSGHRVKNKNAGLLQLNNRTAGGSGRRKIWVADWNGDGKPDLLVNSTNANLLLQTRSTTNRWTFKDVGPLVKQSIQGHTTSPTVVDFNGDAIPDYLGGAEDGRLYYQRNPRSQR